MTLAAIHELIATPADITPFSREDLQTQVQRSAAARQINNVLRLYGEAREIGLSDAEERQLRKHLLASYVQTFPLVEAADEAEGWLSEESRSYDMLQDVLMRLIFY